MRPVDCPEEVRLGEILELPAEDSRRRHVESCPRCRALVLAHEAFQAPPEDPEAERAADLVEDRLEAFRETLMGVATARRPGAPPAGSVARHDAGRRPGWRRTWWRMLFAPPLRPAWALAALGAISVAVLVGIRPEGVPGERVIRGGAAGAMELGDPEVLADGSVRLSWRPAGEAVDRYEVVFFSTRLEPLARFPAGPDTVIVLPPETLPKRLGAEGLLLYRVDAMLGRDAVARSETRSLQRPVP